MRVARKMACESVHIKRSRGNVADVTVRNMRFQDCALSAAVGVESGTTRINLKAPHPGREAAILKSSHWQLWNGIRRLCGYGGIKPQSRLMLDTSTRLMVGSPAHVA